MTNQNSKRIRHEEAKAQRGTEEAVIRISGNQGVGYQEIRGTGKQVDTDFVWPQKGTKDTKELDADLLMVIGNW
jgi:hypothetical protein